MSDTPFSADCSRCFGLCCVALSFERSAQFGHDKMAGEPCHYLASDFRCRIHAKREDLGYDGCEAFDCLGAGQRASAAFAGLNHQRDASVARRLYARFSQLMRLQEMRQALTEAARLELDQALHAERLDNLNVIADHAESAIADVDAGAEKALTEAGAFLRRLAPVVDRAMI